MLKKIYDEIRRLYTSGLTQKEIAARANIDQSTISHILRDGPDRVGSLAVATLLRLLPDMRVSFANSPITIQDGHHNSANNAFGADAGALLRRVRRALLNADGLCDKCKIAALAAVMSVETEEE